MRLRDPHRVPLFLRGWIENVPELREAWDDSLAEWVRERDARCFSGRSPAACFLGAFCLVMVPLVLVTLVPPGQPVPLPVYLGGAFAMAVILGVAIVVDHNARRPGRLPLHFEATVPVFALLSDVPAEREPWMPIPFAGRRVAQLVLSTWFRVQSRLLGFLAGLSLGLTAAVLVTHDWSQPTLLPGLALSLGLVAWAVLPAAPLSGLERLRGELLARSDAAAPPACPPAALKVRRTERRRAWLMALNALAIALPCLAVFLQPHLSSLLARSMSSRVHLCAIVFFWGCLLLALRRLALRDLAHRAESSVGRLAAAWDHYRTHAPEPGESRP